MQETLRGLVAGVLLLAATGVAMANDIVIGQTTDLSSVAGGQMRDFNAGAQLYLDAVNARGGITGRRVKLLTLDDGYLPANAAKNAQTLAANPNVLALFGTRGSDPTDAVIEVAERERMALIAPVNGADAVRESKFVFPVRASYKSEVDGILSYFNVAPIEIAVLAQDDKFGRPLSAHIAEKLKQGQYKNIKLVGSVLFDRKATTMDAEVDKVLALRPRAVIALCNPTACSEFVDRLHKRSDITQATRPAVAQLSNVDMLAQYKHVGGLGVVGNPFAQVMPNPHRPNLQISRDFVAAAKAANIPVNYRTYEGYVSAAVLTEGLKRATPLNRQGVRDALENLGMINVGGIAVEYTPARKTGSRLVELVTMDSAGRLVR